MWKWIVSLLDTSKLAGWVRAGVAGILSLVAAKYLGDTVFKDVLSPAVIDTIAVTVSTAVVGWWSQVAKKIDPDYQK
jgi:hypothetical protein